MARTTRGQGQWALGYREPLNPNERSKRDNNPLNVRERIEKIYARNGFDSIDPADLRGRFRWYGLYTQRAPDIPGGKTALLEPEELDDRYFMLRVRIDGGALTSEQLRVIAGISTEFGRDTADITDRQNIQLHWIQIENVPEIWRRLEAVGLSTTEACGDTPRVILGCPLAGVLEEEVLDASPAVREVSARYIGDPEFSNLPRKYKSSISGCAEQCTNHEINDVAFVGVVNEDGEPGYDLWVGGGLSTNPHFAQRLGTFVRPEQVSEVWVGVTSVFRDYGYRRSRNHARLKFLVSDWGAEKFREVLEKEYLGYALPDGAEPDLPATQRDHVGLSKQRDGRFAVGFAPSVGRVSGTLLEKVATLAETYGDGRIRATAQQKLVILDVTDTDGLTTELDSLGLQVKPSVFRRGTMACTGIEFCKLAIVETKLRGEWLYQELERRLPDFDTPLSINVNGCPNSCARFQTADIGFKGSMVRNDKKESVEGFQVHLGGQLGADPRFGRKFRGLKVTAEELPDYCERILRGYLDRREPDETFAAYIARADEAWLV
ncbi:nitrite/sulfite reductase [Fodinicola acaciae]|uniref:nitrite/sulfite reductase n=1 Tax=Fodinicola acaciae TaxID=2681555 RepID=UPI0013D44F76|nr:nitrite/sulfite reductase [Fodinicola acaciae]